MTAEFRPVNRRFAAASANALVQLPLYHPVNGLQLTSRANYIAGLHHQF